MIKKVSIIVLFAFIINTFAAQVWTPALTNGDFDMNNGIPVDLVLVHPKLTGNAYNLKYYISFKSGANWYGFYYGAGTDYNDADANKILSALLSAKINGSKVYILNDNVKNDDNNYPFYMVAVTK